MPKRLADSPRGQWRGCFETRARAGEGATTIHAVAYPLERTRVRLVRLRPPQPLMEWCRANRVSDAITGGFSTGPDQIPLGDHRIAGQPIKHEPFRPPWASQRAALHIDGARISLAARSELPADPPGDLIQAGPMLVRDHVIAIPHSGDPEGFSADADLFDQDITDGRLPRAALGVSEHSLIAAVADGRSDDDAGLTLRELGEVLVELGALRAINLDGGASSALIAQGRIRNRPRGDDGSLLPAGRPAPTALVIRRPR